MDRQTPYTQGINKLPTELHFEILSYLTDNIESQISASEVCHLWKSIILTDPYFQLLRYVPLQTIHAEMIAVHQIFGLAELWMCGPDAPKTPMKTKSLTEIRCKVVGEEIVSYHCVLDKDYHAYGKEYNFGPPPEDEPGVLDISHSSILDEQCIRNKSTLPMEEREPNDDTPRLTAPLEELDILSAIHYRGGYYPDVIFAEPANFLVEGGFTIRQFLEDIVKTMIVAMDWTSDLDTKKEHYVYLAMRYVRDGRDNECWFRIFLCHPDVRMSDDGKLLNVVKGACMIRKKN
ncbi:hypothetical protein TWF718_010403 [Orbilia javanica]|uniref:F-box domain-containing protein n=1 Tax=Orbilia javanica TaxID=47235 RepID=A0AAN8RE49_9PEZI